MSFETVVVLAGGAFALIQFFMGIILWLTSRLLNKNEQALESLRKALEGMNARLLGDTLPRNEFERFYDENRRDLREVFNRLDAVSKAVARIEARLEPAHIENSAMPFTRSQQP